MDETRVQQLLDSQELTEEMLKNYVIGYEKYSEANKIVSERYDKVLELFKQEPDLIDAENQESIVKIILGGGDRST
jgi:flagellar biosynthesis/type III secretory pathway protein FliH